MAERLQELWKRVLEWWNRFTAKQKTFIIISCVAVAVLIAGLVTLLTREQYVLLSNCENTKEASQITALLDGEGITYEISDDGLQIKVLEEQQSAARLLLGANDIVSTGYTMDYVTSGGFGTTESDKERRCVVFLENKLENDFIEKFDAITSARVELNLATDDGTLIAETKESFASVLLELQDDFSEDNAAFLARAIATAIGNKSTQNIVIMDTAGNMLFSGDDSLSGTGSANSQLSAKTKAENQMKSEVKSVLLGTKEFDNVEVACNLDMVFSSSNTVLHEYFPADGQSQGVLSHRDTYNAENSSGVSGIPGTDSNTEDDTTYVIEDNSSNSSTVSEESYDYLPNERITTTDNAPGVIQYDTSSLSATLINYNVIREEDAKTQGFLEGISWDEYKLANSQRTKQEVDDELYQIVAKATGIPVANIALVAYSENVFFDKEGSAIKLTDIIQILLVLVILGLLAFVVLRSMKGEALEENPQEELSVETLLQSSPETELEDISIDDESETKKMINKFVEENPEAAAALLRNWLNEEWG